jgi:ribonucleoside-diphosphate reductase alpha chain
MPRQHDNYEPQGFALKIFKQRYALHENETWTEACERVGGHVATAENGENVPKYRALFSDVLKKNLFMPGGRIWYGSGRPKGQLLNCFVAPTEDSREGWGRAVSDLIVICGTGGGLGLNCSPIRPRNSPINGTGGVATGAVSLMEIIDKAGDVIRAGGGRRTALMLCLNLDHGDLVEFLDKKLDLKQLTNANVSVVFNENPEDFFALVKKDLDLEFKFRGRVIGKAKARDIWKKIVSNALKGGEPGLLNGYLANKMNNIWYHAELISTNPCGEIWLSEYDCCCLGAVVLPRFVVGSGEVSATGDKVINWSELKKTVQLAVRFLDDVLTVNNYPLPEIRDTCSSIRRIGLGVMGLHDMLLEMGLKYNSDAGLELIDKVMEVIKNTAYETSVELAKEKGSFQAFDSDKFMKSGFVKTLKPSIRSKIKEHGIRNCALLTIAPTGTTALVSDVTSGIEPMFSPVHERRFYEGAELKKEVLVHPLLRKFLDEGRDISHFQGTFDIGLRDHFEVQRTCQRHLDNACSKTINLPQGTSEDELSELYIEFFPDLKGVTIYPDGSRENQPLTPLPLDEALKSITGHESLEAYTNDPCRGGSCDI